MKLVMFNIGRREYGIHVNDVREVLRLTEITPIPDVPVWIEGIINIRDEVVPVISLPRKLGLDCPDGCDRPNRVMIVNFRNRAIGLLVDGVTSVRNFRSRDISESDQLIRTSGIISSVARKGDELLPILDLEKLLNDEKLAGLDTHGCGHDRHHAHNAT